eukprot:519358_1
MAPNDTDNANQNGNITVRNPLGIAVTIGEYDKPHKNIVDVKRDVDCYEKVLVGQYGYTLMCSKDMKGNLGYRMNKKDVIKYVLQECLPALTGGSFDTVKYDALFVAISGHGTVDGVICSDGKVLRYTQIRKWFSALEALEEIPRFFCIDACRVIGSDEQNDLVKRKPGNVSGTNSTTIMGTTEGNTVRGGKVAQYLCDQLALNFKQNQFEGKWKTFGSLYDAAYAKIKVDTKNDNPPQQLTMTEYDRPVDRVVFVLKSIDITREPESNPLLNTDDDLMNLLRPQKDGSTMDLVSKQTYDALYNAGFQTNAQLRTLTKKDLIGTGIKMFHQKELLTRAAKL